MMRFVALVVLTCAPCFGFTLKEAEQKAIAGNAGLAAAALTLDSVEQRRAGANASLLPTLTLEVMRAQRIDENSQGRLFERRAELRANLQNPLLFMAAKDRISYESDLVILDREAVQRSILYAVRKSYFTIRHIQLRREQARHHLESVERVSHISERKYKQGLILTQDNDRSQLETVKQRHRIEELELSLAGAEVQFAGLVADASGARGLTTDLPKQFEFAHLPSDLTQRVATEGKRRSELNGEISRAHAMEEKARFFPEFFVGAQRSTFMDETDTRYFAGVTWTLKPEGYFKARAFTSAAAAADQRSAQAGTDANQKYREVLQEALVLATKLRSQEAVLLIQGRIAQASLEQYNQGYLNLKDYYEDLRMVIAEEEQHLQLRFAAVETLARLAQIAEDDDLFYRSLR